MGILLAALAIPLHSVADAISVWHGTENLFRDAATVAGLVCYVAAIAISIGALAGIGSAQGHVEGAPASTTFFAGGLYRLSIFDAFARRRGIKSKLSLTEFLDALPRETEGVRRELAAEIMTLAYIRDIKLLRQRLAFGFSGAALLLAFLGRL